MKMAIKNPALKAGAALAVILVLAVISCSPEAELSSMDWSQANAATGPMGTSGNVDYRAGGAYVPYLADSYSFPGSGSTPPADYEMGIVFPAHADFLSKPNTQIQGELGKFMDIWTYSNTSPPYNTPSTLGTAVSYTFQRRELNGDKVTVYVTLNLGGINTGIALRIDSAKYTVKGNKLDLNGDRKPGESPFDDVYFTIPVTGGIDPGAFVPPGGPLSGGYYANWTLNLVNADDITYTTSTAPYAAINVTIATLTANLESGNVNTDAIRDAAIQRELEAIINNIKLEKYDNDKDAWAAAGTSYGFYDGSSYLVPNTTDDITGVNSYPDNNSIYVTFTPEDGAIYRVKATGMAYKTTESEYWGVKQKIRVGSGDYWQDTFITAAFTATRDYTIGTGGNGSGRMLIQTAADISSYAYNNSLLNAIHVDSTNDGKNIVLALFFNPIPYGTPVDGTSGLTNTRNAWLSPLSAEQFNRSFKLAHLKSGTVFDWDNLEFLRVEKVEYSTSNYYSNVLMGTNCITLTLASEQQMSSLTNTIFLLLSPGFQYNNSNIIFGDHSAAGIYRKINGVNRWANYGNIEDLVSPF